LITPPRKFSCQFDWKALRIDPKKVILAAPEIKEFPTIYYFQSRGSIPVEPKKRWLLYLQEKNNKKNTIMADLSFKASIYSKKGGGM